MLKPAISKRDSQMLLTSEKRNDENVLNLGHSVDTVESQPTLLEKKIPTRKPEPKQLPNLKLQACMKPLSSLLIKISKKSSKAFLERRVLAIMILLFKSQFCKYDRLREDLQLRYLYSKDNDKAAGNL